MDLLNRTKIDLEELTYEKAKLCIFRSKTRFYEYGEKPTTYYFNLEKSKYNARTCNAPNNDRNELVKDTNGILKLQEQFYRNLYKSDEEICDGFDLTNSYDISVTDEYASTCNLPFTIEELGTAVKQLPNNKTCGNDGIPIEIYKMFWSKLKEPFFELVTEVFKMKHLYSSALIGVINMIPKHQKDTRLLKNLRPITLCNSDYKSIEKALANRIEPALDMILSDNQRGFRKGKRICCNIRAAYEIIKYAKDNELDGMILSLDFEKCFDKIEFNSIIKSLEFFKFPQYIIQWVNILYTDFEACTQNNGFFSKRFYIKRGVHQGGPCSSLLFLICAEILALMIKSDKNIKGFAFRTSSSFLNSMQMTPTCFC